MRDERDRLRDILDAAERAVRFASPRIRQNAGDEVVLAAVTHQLVVIGEAAGCVSQDTRDAYPTLPWHQMTGMRNRVVHAYWSVDAATVWATVESDLPGLIGQLRRALGLAEGA
jgi:uncharacterized protein with HEPN domain